MTTSKVGHPDPVDYFKSQGLWVSKAGPSQWRTTECQLHGGSDSLRFRSDTGGWICMACGAKGGSVVDHHMQLHNCTYVEAAKALGVLGAGAMQRGNASSNKRGGLSARDALGALFHESQFVAIAALNLANGVPFLSEDLLRLKKAAGRIQLIAKDFT